MAYEVWETSSGNLAGSYGSAEKALAVVNAFVQRNGPEGANTFSLVRTGPHRQRIIEILYLVSRPATISPGKDTARA